MGWGEYSLKIAGSWLVQFWSEGVLNIFAKIMTYLLSESPPLALKAQETAMKATNKLPLQS